MYLVSHLGVRPEKTVKAGRSISLSEQKSLIITLTGHHFPSQRVTEVRVLQIRRVKLTKFSPKPLLLLLADTTLSSLLVATAVLPHVVQPPTDDQDELQAERYGGSDGSGDCQNVTVSALNESKTVGMAAAYRSEVCLHL
jgi:hypothetical protein